MRRIQVAAAATSIALIGAVSSIGAASATTNGVGTAQADTTVLSVKIGDGTLLTANLLGDSARSTIDKTIAAPEAFSRLSGLDVTSSVSALNLGNVGGTLLESRTPGGQPSVSGASINLSQPTPTLAIPASVATGTLNLATLTSAVDVAGARSALTAQGTGVSLVGGLLSLSGISSNLGTDAAPTSSAGTRAVKVDQIAVANLGALLTGLGIPLNLLPTATIEGLLIQVGDTVPGVGGGAAVKTLIDAINAEIGTLTLTPLTTPVTGTLADTVNSVVSTLGLTSVITPTTVTSITTTPAATTDALIAQLRTVLANVLSSSVTTLANTTLLQVNGIDVGITTKAADTVAGSAADITAKVGSVTVAGINLPGVDLLAPAASLNTLVSGVNTKLQSVLGTISPDLSNVLAVSVLDQAKSVTSSGGYTRSRAGITALTATLTPPATLAAIVSTVTNAANSVASLITAGGVALPVTAVSMTQLTSTLGSAVGALSAGGTIKVVQVLGAADFAPGGGSSTPGSQLPRTGQDNLLLSALAALLIALGLGLRNWFVQPSRLNV